MQKKGLAAGTIVNRHYTIDEKREEFLKEFFETVTMEFRLTIGDVWDNYFAKSSGPIFKDLAKNVKFRRNS